MAFQLTLQLQFDTKSIIIYFTICEIYWEKKWNEEITLLHFSLKLLEILYIT